MPNHEPDPESGIFNKITEFLSRWSSSHKIKFGGVVGKIAYIAAFCVGGSALIAWRVGSTPLLGVLVVCPLLFGAFVIQKILAWADKHPQLATLEGAEVLQWHQQAMGAKGITVPLVPSAPVAAPLIPDEDVRKIE